MMIHTSTIAGVPYVSRIEAGRTMVAYHMNPERCCVTGDILCFDFDASGGPEGWYEMAYAATCAMNGVERLSPPTVPVRVPARRKKVTVCSFLQSWRKKC